MHQDISKIVLVDRRHEQAYVPYIYIYIYYIYIMYVWSIKVSEWGLNSIVYSQV